MIQVHLSDSEIERAKTFAEAIRISNKTHGIPYDNQITEGATKSYKSMRDYEELGYICQYAVTRALDVPMDWRVRTRGGDGGTDLWYRGRSWQVKGTFYSDGYLAFKRLDKFKASGAILACPDAEAGCSMIYILGWIDRAEFHAKCHKVNMGYGDTWRVDQLHPIEELLDGKAK